MFFSKHYCKGPFLLPEDIQYNEIILTIINTRLLKYYYYCISFKLHVFVSYIFYSSHIYVCTYARVLEVTDVFRVPPPNNHI